MFGFNRFRTLFSVRRQQEDKEGIQLLASMLVCYPELESVSYLPRDAELILDFVIQGKEERPELEQFLHFLDDSLQAYHEMETGGPVWMSVEAEHHADVMIVHVHRQLINMTRGELTLLTSLFREHYADRLRQDSHTLDNMEQDFSDVQSDVLDHILGTVQIRPIRDRLVGIRENDRVVVYNR